MLDRVDQPTPAEAESLNTAIGRISGLLDRALVLEQKAEKAENFSQMKLKVGEVLAGLYENILEDLWESSPQLSFVTRAERGDTSHLDESTKSVKTVELCFDLVAKEINECTKNSALKSRGRQFLLTRRDSSLSGSRAKAQHKASQQG